MVPMVSVSKFLFSMLLHTLMYNLSISSAFFLALFRVRKIVVAILTFAQA